MLQTREYHTEGMFILLRPLEMFPPPLLCDWDFTLVRHLLLITLGEIPAVSILWIEIMELLHFREVGLHVSRTLELVEDIGMCV